MKALSVVPSGSSRSLAIEEIVEALARANTDLLPPRERRLGRNVLPSREALAAILTDLRAALFPAHFGATDISDAGIRNYVGHRLDAACSNCKSRCGVACSSPARTATETETSGPASAAPSR